MRNLLLAAAFTLLTTTSFAQPAKTKVWVNTDSKTYHCQGSQFYGKTKQGQYMNEDAAKAAGNVAANKTPCSS